MYRREDVEDLDVILSNAALGTQVENRAIVGSVHIFGEGKDVDLLVLVPEDAYLGEVAADVSDKGWKCDNRTIYESEESNWFSARKGKYNLLLTRSADFYAAFILAADICQGLAKRGVLIYEDRDSRVLIHKLCRGDA